MWFFALPLLVAIAAAPTADGMIARMKIIDPAATTQAPAAAETNHEHVDYNLKPSIPHSNFTGPTEMKRLAGECFTTNSDNNQYEYRFCPFDNVTQHDIQASWNAYNGVLGVWHSWEVADGKLAQQSFKEGDSCGSYNREVKVLFICGKKDELSKPTEPSPCKYELEFGTPHACNNSMHLVDMLHGEDKVALKVLDDELYDEEITEAGYRKKQRKLLKRSGVLPVRNEPPRPTPPPPTPAPPTPAPYVWKSDSTKLQECDDEKAELKKVSDRLTDTVARLTEELKALGDKLEELGHSSKDVVDSAAFAAAVADAEKEAAAKLDAGADVEGAVVAAASDADGVDVEEPQLGGADAAAATVGAAVDAAAARDAVAEKLDGGANVEDAVAAAASIAEGVDIEEEHVVTAAAADAASDVVTETKRVTPSDVEAAAAAAKATEQ
eukprot:gene12461-19504_t